MATTDTVTRDDIEGLVREVLIEELDVDPDQIVPEATMEELDLDSLDLVEIGQIVEQRYGVRIKASDAEGVSDFRGVVDMIHSRVTGGGGDDE